MKHILSMVMALALATSQAFSYSTDTLKRVEETTAATQTAGAVVGAIASGGASGCLEGLAKVSKEINTLASYALMDFTFMPRIARVIERLNAEASWQAASRDGGINRQYFKQFSVSLAHGIAHEARAYFRGKGIGLALQSISDNRIVARASHALGEALSAAIVEVAFVRLGHAVLAANDAEAPKCSTVFLNTLFTGFATEAAYHLAGEIILRNATNVKSQDLFSDLFGSH